MSIIQPISLQTFLGPNRKLGNLNVQVVINESTNDTLTITKQPVQQGASITDHAYREPTAFSATMFYRDNPLKSLSKTYQELLDLQNSRVPFTIITPKRIYKSMLISALGQTTDKSTENCLSIQLTCQEIIIVSVTTTQVPRGKQKQAAATGKTEAAGKKSALSVISTGIQGLFQ